MLVTCNNYTQATNSMRLQLHSYAIDTSLTHKRVTDFSTTQRFFLRDEEKLIDRLGCLYVCTSARQAGIEVRVDWGGGGTGLQKKLREFTL